MLPWFAEDFGNPSSATHAWGWRAEAAVEDARERLAAAIGASHPSEIVFTSGTTESDNLAIQGIARAGRRQRNHLVTVSIEHAAVLDCCRALEAEGFELSVLSVDREGLVDPEDVKQAIGERTALVSVGTANGEIGAIQPLEEIAAVCRERGVPVHTDAAQAAGKVPLSVDGLGVDLLSMCAHKLYGPKGVGLLYVRRRRPRLRLSPPLHGGGHERGLRPGTLPVPLVVGFARAVELCVEDLAAESARLTALRQRLWGHLRALGGVHLNGPSERRLPGNLNVSFEGVEADALIASLPDVALSSGSACSSASAEPSHVLAALGLPDALSRAALRFGLGRQNTAEEIDRVAGDLAERLQELRGGRTAAGAPPVRRLHGP